MGGKLHFLTPDDVLHAASTGHHLFLLPVSFQVLREPQVLEISFFVDYRWILMVEVL